ncbi:hypothetical protein Pint_03203 [Pistacia integerrima]|uniref:Uncharacterized protein n=1 Tax=Pistacia integerrima TaxID=434235 RepID=A0ACC0ZKP3_9ROSI|nr:hypothetical protein Pint_03203 [Pistacia integerrima]
MAKMGGEVGEKEKLGFEATELRLGLPGNNGGGGEGEGGGAAAAAARKRGFSETVDLKLNLSSKSKESFETDPNEKVKSLQKEKNHRFPSATDPAKPPAKVRETKKETAISTIIPPREVRSCSKAQVVGWPPVRSFRKNMLAVQKSSPEESEMLSVNGGASLVKVSMDGAPYLRKVDLKMYKNYQDLYDALGKMFSSLSTIGNCGSQGMKDFMNESKLMDLLNGSDYVPTYEDKDGDWMLVGDVPWGMFVESCKRLRIMKGTEAIGLAPRAMEKCKNRS